MRLARSGNFRAALLIALLAGALGPRSARAAEPVSSVLTALFPKSDEVKGWQQQAAPKLFPGPQVFDYMDGAGEIPRSYGLNQLGSALYRKGAVTLEAAIFNLKSPEGAFGYASIRGFLDRSPTGADRTVQLDH